MEQEKAPTPTNILTAIQCELKVPKKHWSEFGKYHYRNCDDIMEAVKPILKRYDVELIISDETKSVLDVMYIESTCVLKKDGEIIGKAVAQAGIEKEKKKFDISQLFGSASSYSRKYSLNGLFLLDDNKDADAMKDAENKASETKPIKLDEKRKALIKEVMDEYGKLPNELKNDKMSVWLANIDQCHSSEIQTALVNIRKMK